MSQAAPDLLTPARRIPWRAPDLPREHLCAEPRCGCAAVYGFGDQWFCDEHKPAGFTRESRGEGPASEGAI